MTFELNDTLRLKLEALEQCIHDLVHANLPSTGNERMNNWRMNALYFESFLIPLPGRILFGESPSSFELSDLSSFFDELEKMKPSLSKNDVAFWNEYYCQLLRLKEIYFLLVECGCPVISTKETELRHRSLVEDISVESLLRSANQCVAEYEITMAALFPFHKMKIKIYPRPNNSLPGYIGYSNVQIRDQGGSLYASIGNDTTIEKTLNETLRNFLESINDIERPYRGNDFQYLDEYVF